MTAETVSRDVLEYLRAEVADGCDVALTNADAAYLLGEIERLRGALQEISTTFHGNPTKYMEAANRAVEIADAALDGGPSK